MSERKDFLLRLSAEDHERLRNLAHFTKRPMAEIVRTVLHDYLSGPGRAELVEAITTSGQREMRDLLDKLAQESSSGRTGTR